MRVGQADAVERTLQAIEVRVEPEWATRKNRNEFIHAIGVKKPAIQR